jgi:hypothetical protein
MAGAVQCQNSETQRKRKRKRGGPGTSSYEHSCTAVRPCRARPERTTFAVGLLIDDEIILRVLGLAPGLLAAGKQEA